MPYSWITIEDKPVLNVDYRNLTSEEIVALVKDVNEVTDSQSGKLLFIINVEGVSFTTKMFTELMSENIGHIFSKKHEYAVFIGVTGLKKVMFNMFMKMYNIKACLQKQNLKLLDLLMNTSGISLLRKSQLGIAY